MSIYRYIPMRSDLDRWVDPDDAFGGGFTHSSQSVCWPCENNLHSNCDQIRTEKRSNKRSCRCCERNHFGRWTGRLVLRRDR